MDPSAALALGPVLLCILLYWRDSQTSLGMVIDCALHAGVWSKAINARLVGPLDLILLGHCHFSVLPEPLFLVKKKPTHMLGNHTGKVCARVYGTPTNLRSGCYFVPA